MKKIIYFIVFALCLLLFSCTSSPSNDESLDEQFLLNPISGGSSVWVVEKDGNTLYLGGSIHLLREEDFPLPEEFDLAFSLSDALVLEADITLAEDPEVAFYMLTQMLLPDGQTLRDMLDEETFSMLAEATLAYGVPIDLLSGFKPSMVITMLTFLQYEAMGFTEQGIDELYYYRALGENKPVFFLETLESQLHVLLSMGEGHENEFVRYSIMDLDNIDSHFVPLLQEFRTGQSALSEETLMEMRAESYDLYRALITARHEAWMPQIINFIESGDTYFIIVGMLHMHGPDGLLRLLMDLGYTVRQL